MSAALKKKAMAIAEYLQANYDDATTSLDYSKPHELLVATILSAQCTDERVNIVTKDLFKKYRTVKAFADADLGELEKDIHSTGFFKNKAKNIKGCCAAIIEKHGGKVPGTMEELVELPGVGRKTANVVLGNAFGTPGVIVDTHVSRIAQRSGLSKNSDPVKIEFDIMELIPQKMWTDFSNQLVWHGRRICDARKPKCGECGMIKHCDFGKKSQ
ncbi:MAG TPA: endonuclease III [bacterium]|nr:endonuclease III [bacterium]